jgi:hypothetical protein
LSTASDDFLSNSTEASELVRNLLEAHGLLPRPETVVRNPKPVKVPRLEVLGVEVSRFVVQPIEPLENTPVAINEELRVERSAPNLESLPQRCDAVLEVTKGLEVYGRTANILPCCGLTRQLPFVQGCFGTPDEQKRAGRTIIRYMVVKDPAKDELVQPARSIWELGCQGLRNARSELRAFLRYESIKGVVRERHRRLLLILGSSGQSPGQSEGGARSHRLLTLRFNGGLDGT